MCSRINVLAIILALAASRLLAQDAGPQNKPADVVIYMTEGGEYAKYIEKSKYKKGGKNDQKWATVTVGATVSWKNLDKEAHTAQCAFFDTKALKQDDESAPILFTAEMFKKARETSKKVAGQADNEVMIDYFCLHHKNTMRGRIKLVDKK